MDRPPVAVTRENSIDYVRTLTRKTADRLQESLRNSSETRARAVGLLMQTYGIGGDPVPEVSEGPRDELVQLAIGAGDPFVYMLAMNVCRPVPGEDLTPASCQRITPDGWARADSGNATAWLAVAQRARAHGDSGAEADAFAHAADAIKLESYFGAFLQVGQEQLPPSSTALDRAWIAVTFIGLGAANVQPYREITDYCTVETLQNAIVRKECNAIAELLVQGRLLLDLSIGERLGERLEWPGERLNALLDEREALTQALPPDSPQPWSCEHVAKLNELAQKIGQEGEVDALRELRGEAAKTP